MQTRKVGDTKIHKPGLRVMPAAVLAALGVLVLGGCASQSADQPPAQPVQVNFALDKCQQIQPNLFKCPAIDLPICTPQFVRTDVNCVRVGPKGSVFVQRGGMP